MRASFRPRSPKLLSRSVARNSVLINQLATPGLGSLLAGRFVAGIGQLLLALAGFGMVMGWFVLLLVKMYEEIEGATQPKSMGWLGEFGALLFAAAWLWALFTSLSLLRQARENESNLPPQTPPLLKT